MSELVTLSESKLREHANGTVIDVVSSTTSPSGETVQRPLDSDDILELQQSRLTTIPNSAVYTVVPETNIAVFNCVIRDSALERTIERRERNDHFPDTVSPEFVIAREAAWIASTINNGQHLRRHIGYVSHDDYRVEIAARDGTSVSMTIVFNGQG